MRAVISRAAKTPMPGFATMAANLPPAAGLPRQAIKIPAATMVSPTSIVISVLPIRVRLAGSVAEQLSAVRQRRTLNATASTANISGKGRAGPAAQQVVPLAPRQERAYPNNAMLGAGCIDFSSAVVAAPMRAKRQTNAGYLFQQTEALARVNRCPARQAPPAPRSQRRRCAKQVCHTSLLRNSHTLSWNGADR